MAYAGGLCGPASEEHRANLPIPLRAMRDNFERTETISEHEVTKPECSENAGVKRFQLVGGPLDRRDHDRLAEAAPLA